MFVGYSVNSKAYQLIEFATGNIKISHNVIFDKGAKMISFESNMSKNNEKIVGAMDVN
jgi:hypothetical protein